MSEDSFFRKSWYRLLLEENKGRCPKDPSGKMTLVRVQQNPHGVGSQEDPSVQPCPTAPARSWDAAGHGASPWGWGRGQAKDRVRCGPNSAGPKAGQGRSELEMGPAAASLGQGRSRLVAPLGTSQPA